MKIRILYALFVAFSAAALFWNSAGGAAASQNADRTGSPLSTSTCGATACHSNGSFNPSLNVQLLDGEMGVTAYEPGKTYTLRVAITGADAASGFGFQSVLLHGDDNLNAGTFGDAPTGMQVTPLNDRMYAEHSMRNTSSVFTIDWTAPASGVGDIRIYAAGNAANGNGSNSGDNGVSLSAPVVLNEAGTSNTQDYLLSFDAIQISPNPTRDGATLMLDNSRPGRYTLNLYNATGQNLYRQQLNLVQGTQSHWVDLSEQPNGIYFLQLSDGQQQLTRKILKQ